MRYGNGENYWLVEGSHFDISRGSATSATIGIEAEETLQFDPKRSALVIIDMQNFFCSALLGRSDGAIQLVPAIRSAIESSRKLGIQIVWVNWGNRADTANLPPNMLYSRRKRAVRILASSCRTDWVYRWSRIPGRPPWWMSWRSAAKRATFGSINTGPAGFRVRIWIKSCVRTESTRYFMRESTRINV